VLIAAKTLSAAAISDRKSIVQMGWQLQRIGICLNKYDKNVKEVKTFCQLAIAW